MNDKSKFRVLLILTVLLSPLVYLWGKEDRLLIRHLYTDDSGKVSGDRHKDVSAVDPDSELAYPGSDITVRSGLGDTTTYRVHSVHVDNKLVYLSAQKLGENETIVVVTSANGRIKRACVISH